MSDNSCCHVSRHTTHMDGQCRSRLYRLRQAYGPRHVIVLSSHPLSEPAPKRKGGQGQQGLHLRLGVGVGLSGSGPVPAPNLVDNTGEGGVVRRAANSYSHP